MAEQVLLYPGLLVGDAELLLCVDVEVVGALLVKENVFCIQYFVATSHVVVLQTYDVTLCESKLFLLSIVDYLLDVPPAESRMLRKCSKNENARHSVDCIFKDFPLSGAVQ